MSGEKRLIHCNFGIHNGNRWQNAPRDECVPEEVVMAFCNVKSFCLGNCKCYTARTLSQQLVVGRKHNEQDVSLLDGLTTARFGNC